MASDDDDDDFVDDVSRDYYPRVLEHIINTQSPQVLCRDYKEILGTLDIISTDPGQYHDRVINRKLESSPTTEVAVR
uniref:Uncharacterized protein n=1 Tax=Anopheles stephensi TaxID=30069 RepID=A0A182YJK2_ANOST